jgi:hypothetical protein
MVNDLGLSAYVVDVGVLGHAKPRLMGTYMPGVPWSELRATMEAWAAEFARIVGAPHDAASGPVVAEPAVEHV